MRRPGIETRWGGLTGFGGAALLAAFSALPLAAGAEGFSGAVLQNVAQPISAMTVSPFAQAVSVAVARDKALADFYRQTQYKPVWTGAEDAARRQAFLDALSQADLQGLPSARYDRAGLIAKLQSAQTERDRAVADVAMSAAFVKYARDASSGVIDPEDVASGIVRHIDRPDPVKTLEGFVAAEPVSYIQGLLPQAPEYNELLKAKLTLENMVGKKAWGPKVSARALKPGQTGPQVIALRDRLIAMGYLAPTATAGYDTGLQAAVTAFQMDHGLKPTGEANPDTVAQINLDPVDRLKSVMVAMERWRWMPRDLGEKHVWVNLPDFSAKVYVDGKVIFSTPAVVGKNTKETRTPEFSDRMEYMVVNPTWNVPRSIATKEYLPAFQKDPNADSQLQLINAQGQVVSRDSVDFSQFNANNFPFDIKQPPSRGNALGLVKFMFPNRYNIYLHDTPTKYLFKRQVRAYSHGCVRLERPFDLAYTLLGWQSSDPKREFKAALARGVEDQISLKTALPVHLVYFTAIPTATGRMEYRRDIYGRDARIFDALERAGVAFGPNSI